MALCAGCGTSPPEQLQRRSELTLLHTSDLHSHLWPTWRRITSFEAELGLGAADTRAEVGGAARLATLLAQQRRQGPSLWLDSGDLLEGTAVFSRFGGRAEVAWFGAEGLGAAALGNHELSLSGDGLAHALLPAPFPLLSSNLEPTDDSPLVGRVIPSAVLSLGDLRVGVIGVSHPDSPAQLRQSSNPWGLLEAPDTAAAVQAAIDGLSGRAQLIVVLSHQGLDRDRELVAGTSGIDLVLGGHQHIVTEEPEWQDDCQPERLQMRRGCSTRRVPIVHSGAYGAFLSTLKLRLRRDTERSVEGSLGDLELESIELRHLPVTADVTAEPATSEMLDGFRPEPTAPLAFAPSGLSRRAVLGGDSGLGDLFCDAVRQATGADVVLLNSSALRADLESGVLLRSDLELAMPFEEPWLEVWVTGGELKGALLRTAARSAAQDCASTLQVSGLRLELHCDACRTGAERCLQATRDFVLGAEPLRDDALLHVALPQYLALPGADFEALARPGGELSLSVVDDTVRLLSALPGAPQGEDCEAALRSWPLERCREAFGLNACPLSSAATHDNCRGLPELLGGRDDRIAMWP